MHAQAAERMRKFTSAFGMDHPGDAKSGKRMPGMAASGRKRTIYAEGERQVSLGRLTTRCPAILRDYLKYASSNPMTGYRSLTHMVTMCLIEFMEEVAKPHDPKMAWAKGRGASAGTVLVHANTERSVSKAGDVFLDGVELAAHALSVAESLEVNMSSFTLTLLFWMATDKHPPSDAKMRRAIAAARKTCFA